ncbi:MAG: 50S ribosomal protein L11 methyltransferase, partial [Gammaproteobacteria bacterium]|nr:50S ribosomal protein L11 methyltransferase [Gammaproteobacteria bacterium]
PLTELAPTLVNTLRQDGLLILSGIMTSQRDWVVGAYDHLAELVEEAELNGWIRLVWKR